jgi:cell wall-associated NlpC family hydrolase
VKEGTLVPAVVPRSRGRACRALAALLAPLFVAAFAGVAVVAASVTIAGPAAASSPVRTQVRASDHTINFGRHADMTIRVVTATRSLGGAHVRVYRHTTSGNVYVTRVTTGAVSHVAHFRPYLRRSTTYLLVFRGTASYAASAHYKRVYVRSFGASLVHIGDRKIGSPYQYGAAGPYRFDCSGFTRWVASRYGKDLPHSSSAQYGIVRHISRSSKRLGDLVFVHDSSGHVYHVGFYAGDGRLLAATHTGDYVRIERLWTSSYYVGRLRTP